MTDELRQMLEQLLAVAYDPEATPARRLEAAALWFDLAPGDPPGVREARCERRRRGCPAPADDALVESDNFLGEHEGRLAGLLAASLDGIPHRLLPWEGAPPPGWSPPSAR